MRKNKAIVLSDLHELLSKAKNPTAYSIRICDPKFILPYYIKQASPRQCKLKKLRLSFCSALGLHYL